MKLVFNEKELTGERLADKILKNVINGRLSVHLIDCLKSSYLLSESRIVSPLDCAMHVLRYRGELTFVEEWQLYLRSVKNSFKHVKIKFDEPKKNNNSDIMKSYLTGNVGEEETIHSFMNTHIPGIHYGPSYLETFRYNLKKNNNEKALKSIEQTLREFIGEVKYPIFDYEDILP